MDGNHRGSEIAIKHFANKILCEESEVIVIWVNEK